MWKLRFRKPLAYSGFSSDRITLSPFTKDFRGEKQFWAFTQFFEALLLQGLQMCTKNRQSFTSLRRLAIANFLHSLEVLIFRTPNLSYVHSHFMIFVLFPWCFFPLVPPWHPGIPWLSSGEDSVLSLPWAMFNPWLGTKLLQATQRSQKKKRKPLSLDYMMSNW